MCVENLNLDSKYSKNIKHAKAFGSQDIESQIQRVNIAEVARKE